MERATTLLLLTLLLTAACAEDKKKGETAAVDAERKTDKRGATSYTQVSVGNNYEGKSYDGVGSATYHVTKGVPHYEKGFIPSPTYGYDKGYGVKSIAGYGTNKGYFPGFGTNKGYYNHGHAALIPVALIPVYNHGYNHGYAHGYGGYGYNKGEPVKSIYTKEVPVPVPHLLPITIEKKIPYPVKVPVAVPYERPYPVHVYKHIPVPVEKPVPYPVERPVPYPVKIPVKVPVAQPLPYPVPTPVPVPVYVKPNYNKGYYDKGYDEYGSASSSSEVYDGKSGYNSDSKN
ncbi:uncharacterized protein LOC128987866 [Macrosteles quadrilineatus]|uniref:uncharacterized protein LOC128987866 n=1 Tax=Macrosteles quadrilineatus TaxID=74068 RepID=UPI0023E32897|nr:uncharacterized protein LOC128987866 [Macrosteles quadrilineatus]